MEISETFPTQTNYNNESQSNKTSFLCNLAVGDIFITNNNETIVGGIIGEVIEEIAEKNISGCNIDIQSTKLETYVSSITIVGAYDINYSQNYVLSDSTIKINNQASDKVGTVIYTSYLDQIFFYI